MKKILSTLLLMVAVMLPVAAVAKGNNTNELPSTAKTTINKYFGKSKVNHIKIDKKMFGGAEYDVVLTNGTEIQFDSKGNWNEISFGTNKLPKGLLPKNLTDYLNKNFKKQNVTGVSLKRNKYDVTLSNGSKLEFDRSGEFSKVTNGSNKLPDNIVPKSVNDYLKKHFKKYKIVSMTKDRYDYEVTLSDGTEVEFDAKGNMQEIHLGSGKLPDKILPKTITDYVKKNFKKQTIKAVAMDHENYELKLSSGIQLEFDKTGQIRTIDYK